MEETNTRVTMPLTALRNDAVREAMARDGGVDLPSEESVVSGLWQGDDQTSCYYDIETSLVTLSMLFADAGVSATEEALRAAGIPFDAFSGGEYASAPEVRYFRPNEERQTIALIASRDGDPLIGATEIHETLRADTDAEVVAQLRSILDRQMFTGPTLRELA